MSLRFTNTFTRKIENFTSLDPAGKSVKLYTCGPTVYNYAHIGNFRAYIFEDLLQRHLEASGYHVDRVMNLTDVDDKTIRGCQHAGVALHEFTAPYKQAFFEDLDTLRIRRAQHFPAATDDEQIARMIDMIARLIAHGHAYQAEDQSVYFRIGSFPAYGKLAHLNLDELRPSGRVSSDDYEKESVGDFALWKAWDEADGAVGWESPFGRGRPGWHIECSAMATGLLGDQLDIHCGGVDNIFPHHEAEIAQTEALTGKPFVRLWMHCAHLMVDGQKMSKSLGNFYTLRDLLGKGFTGREVRFALLRVNYAKPLNFTIEDLATDVRESLRRLDEWRTKLEDHSRPAPFSEPHPLSDHRLFEEALDYDLNISCALGQLFVVVRETNLLLDAGRLSPAHARRLLEWWARVNAVLALEPDVVAVPAEITTLLEQRAAARAARDFAASDTLRGQIAAFGWTVKDTKEGQKLIPAS